MTDRLPPLPHLRVLAHGTIDGKPVEIRGWHEGDLDEWFYQVHRMLVELTADRDSWIEQASQRAQETVEAMQQVEAYRLRCEALHSAPQEPLTTQGVAGPLVNKWAEDEYVQFVSRSDGQRTTATVSRDALLLLADRAIAAGHAIASQPVAQGVNGIGADADNVRAKQP